MKTIFLFCILLFCPFLSWAQVEIDKPVVFTGGAGQSAITGLLDVPTNDGDAANKKYVDDQIQSNSCGLGTAPGQTPYWSGSAWVLDHNIYNNGDVIGIGAPPAIILQSKLDVLKHANLTTYSANTSFRVSNNSSATEYSRLLFGQVTTNQMFIEAGNQINEKGNLLLQPYGGNVGISGGTGSPTYTLQLFASNGAGSAAKPSGGSWTNPSDIRLKSNIRPYEDGLSKILQINPVTYRYNSDTGFDTGLDQVGVIAQDLKEIAPYMVGTFEWGESKESYLDVNNSAMTYMLINAVKEQQEMINQLKTIQVELERRIQQLEIASTTPMR